MWGTSRNKYGGKPPPQHSFSSSFQLFFFFLITVLYSTASFTLGRSVQEHSRWPVKMVGSLSYTLLSLTERWMAVGFVPFAKNMSEMCRGLSPHLIHQAEAWIRTFAQSQRIFTAFTVFQLLSLELQSDLPQLARNKLWLLSLGKCQSETHLGLYVLPVLQKIKDCIPTSLPSSHE